MNVNLMSYALNPLTFMIQAQDFTFPEQNNPFQRSTKK
jgi:hypothetical protein